MIFRPVYPSKFCPSVMTPLSLLGHQKSMPSTLTPGMLTLGVEINGVNVEKWAMLDWFDIVGFPPPAQKEYYMGQSNAVVTVFDFRCPIELAYFKLYFGIS